MSTIIIQADIWYIRKDKDPCMTLFLSVVHPELYDIKTVLLFFSKLYSILI